MWLILCGMLYTVLIMHNIFILNIYTQVQLVVQLAVQDDHGDGLYGNVNSCSRHDMHNILLTKYCALTF